MSHIIVATVDSRITAQLQHALAGDGYKLAFVRSCLAIAQATRRSAPSMIIIDSHLSDMEGLSICRDLRNSDSARTLPIMYLAHDPTPARIAEILDAGADDIIRMPFIDREIAARVRALLRRRSPHKAIVLTLNADARSAELAGRTLSLTRTEFDLLWALSEHRGCHLDAETLLQEVWSYPDGAGDTALVRNHIRNLRRKMEHDPDHPRHLLSRHGRGYTLVVDDIRRVRTSAN